MSGFLEAERSRRLRDFGEGFIDTGGPNEERRRVLAEFQDRREKVEEMEKHPETTISAVEEAFVKFEKHGSNLQAVKRAVEKTLKWDMDVVVQFYQDVWMHSPRYHVYNELGKRAFSSQCLLTL